jgi:hypothetical protein
MNALGFQEKDKTREAFSVGVGGAREKGFEIVVPRFFVLGRRFQAARICVFEMSYLESDRVDGLLVHCHLNIFAVRAKIWLRLTDRAGHENRRRSRATSRIL